MSSGQIQSQFRKILPSTFGFKRSNQQCKFLLLINYLIQSRKCQLLISKSNKKISPSGSKNIQLKLTFSQFKYSGPTKLKNASKCPQELTLLFMWKRGHTKFSKCLQIEFFKTLKKTSDKSMSNSSLTLSIREKQLVF
jgi:hypothetical protein